MSTIISLPEKESLKSQATKYLVEKIGYNIRPNEPQYFEEENQWVVECRATISNYISNIGSEGKQFIYNFDNVAKLIFQDVDGDFRIIKRPKKSDIERTIYEKYLTLTHRIERELLIAGRNSWGKLTLVKYFLSPLYSMITNLFDKGHISIDEITTGQNYKFFRLLLSEGYIIVDPDNENIFVSSNKLTNFLEDQYAEYENTSLFSATENAVGIIFGNNYNTIKYDFGIRPPSSYVDYTKTYYFDALRYGELIHVDEDDIRHSLENFNIIVNDKLNFQKSLVELSNTDLINKTDKYYYGDDAIFSQLYTFREGLLEGIAEP